MGRKMRLLRQLVGSVVLLAVMFACASSAGEDGGAAEPSAGEAPQPTMREKMAEVDAQLADALSGNLAYNRPKDMQLEQTIVLQLLLSPEMSAQALQDRVTESGSVAGAEVSITPRMRAELQAPDSTAFTIQPLHVSPEQLVSTLEPTEWKWSVTALKEGTQRLRLMVYRLVEYEGKEYWRAVKEFEDVIQIEVTLGQRLARFDWYWLVGIAITGLALPVFFIWLQRRRKTGDSGAG